MTRQSRTYYRLLGDLSDVPAEYIRDVSHMKRFLERWTMDPKYQEAFASDPEAALTDLGIELTPAEVIPLMDREAALEATRLVRVNRVVGLLGGSNAEDIKAFRRLEGTGVCLISPDGSVGESARGGNVFFTGLTPAQIARVHADVHDLNVFFATPHGVAMAQAPIPTPTVKRETVNEVRFVGGLPDPAFFPRVEWLRM